MPTRDVTAGGAVAMIGLGFGWDEQGNLALRVVRLKNCRRGLKIYQVTAYRLLRNIQFGYKSSLFILDSIKCHKAIILNFNA